jgi:hypothetical protein
LGESEPCLFQFVLAAKLLTHPLEKAVVPLFCGQVLTEAGQIEDRDSRAVVAQADSGSDHERGLAHLAGCQDVTKLASLKKRVKILISGS